MRSPPSLSRSRSRHGPVCVVARYRNRRSQKEKKPRSPDSEASVLDKAGQNQEAGKSSTSLEARFAALQPPPPTSVPSTASLEARFLALQPPPPLVDAKDAIRCPLCSHLLRIPRGADTKQTLAHHQSTNATCLGKQGRPGRQPCPECGKKNRYGPMVPSAAQAILPGATRKGYPKQAWLPLSGAPN